MPAKKRDALPDEKLIDLARMTFEHFESQLHFGDTKAQLTLGVNAVLIGSLASFGKEAFSALLDPASSFVEKAIGVLAVPLFVSILLSVMFSLLAAQPNLRPPLRKPESPQEDNLYFFGSVQGFSPSDYDRRFSAQSGAQARAAILEQVHAKARIAERKFTNTRRGLYFLYLSFLLWAVMQALSFFIAD
ncbi:MAG: Pycsar system effector family protein [Chloroflexota bacterium]